MQAVWKGCLLGFWMSLVFLKKVVVGFLNDFGLFEVLFSIFKVNPGRRSELTAPTAKFSWAPCWPQRLQRTAKVMLLFTFFF